MSSDENTATNQSDGTSGEGDEQGSKTGMGIDGVPADKSGGTSGEGDEQGSKTGMGIENGYALLIGTGRCSYPQWSLPVTVRDVTALRQVLVDSDHCAYLDDERHVRVLTDEEATRDNILAALADLAAVAREDPRATVVVCYTGHGWAADGDRFFLIPHDVEPHRLTETALPAEAFIAGLREIRPRRLLVLLDTCHAEAMATAKGSSVPLLPEGFRAEPLPKGFAEQLAKAEGLGQGEGRAVFNSCRQDQKSWIAPGWELSIFTHHLVAALQGAGNKPEDEFVMVSDLMKYVSREVKKTAREMNREQTPYHSFETPDFPVALLRGGAATGPAGEKAKREGRPLESPIYNVQAGRDSIIARDVDRIQTGNSRSLALFPSGPGRDILSRRPRTARSWPDSTGGPIGGREAMPVPGPRASGSSSADSADREEAMAGNVTSKSERLKMEHSTLMEEYRSLKNEIVANLASARQVVALTLTAIGALIAGTPHIVRSDTAVLFLIAGLFFHGLAWIQLRYVFLVFDMGKYLRERLIPRIREVLASLGPDEGAKLDCVMAWEDSGKSPVRQRSGHLLRILFIPIAGSGFGIPLLAAVLCLAAFGVLTARGSGEITVVEHILLAANLIAFIYGAFWGFKAEASR